MFENLLLDYSKFVSIEFSKDLVLSKYLTNNFSGLELSQGTKKLRDVGRDHAISLCETSTNIKFIFSKIDTYFLAGNSISDNDTKTTLVYKDFDDNIKSVVFTHGSVWLTKGFSKTVHYVSSEAKTQMLDFSVHLYLSSAE